MTDDATARRRHLGRLLRSARKTAGLTQAAVAKKLDCGQAKINKIETMLVAICAEDLDKLIETYGLAADDAAELRRLATLDQQKGPARTKHTNLVFNDLTEREPEAREILCLHGERFPGPLQAESFMLAQHAHLIADGNDVLDYMLQRANRVRVFTVDDPPWYRAIISESALRRIPAQHAATLLADQVAYLLELLNTYEKVDLRILPFGADVPYVDTDFEILRFFGNGQPDFAYVEYPCGSKKFTKAEDLKMFQEHWDLIQPGALSREETRKFLAGYIPPSPEQVP